MSRSTARAVGQVDEAPDWWLLDGDMHAWFGARSHAAAAALGGRIADLVGANNLPDLDVRGNGVRVRIAPIGSRASTTDLELTHAVSVAARELGLEADHAALQVVRLVIESSDQPAARSFWQEVLGYVRVGDSSLADPLRREPVLAFRGRADRRPLRDRLHVDVVRLPEAVRGVRTALDREPFGVYGLTLADGEGNEVDLVPGDVLTESTETSDWRIIFSAMTCYPTTASAEAVQLLATAAGLADSAGVSLSLDLRPAGLIIDSGKDQWEGKGAADPAFVHLAQDIQQSARPMGLVAEPSRLRFVQVGIDVTDVDSARGFWTRVLGYRRDPRPEVTDIYDPLRLAPVIIFQPMDRADIERLRQRNRLRLEVQVPADQVQARIDSGVGSGGRVVGRPDENRWTLADPDGNELEIVAAGK